MVESRSGTRVTLARSVTIAVVGLLLMTAIASAALVALTTSLHETSAVLRESVAAVRLTREAEVEILLLERTVDEDERRRLETALLEKVEVQLEQRSVEAAGRIRDYLDASEPEREERLEAALQALDRVASGGIAEADRARRRAEVLNRWGDLVGYSTVGIMAAALTLALLWTRRHIVRPTLRLGEAMKRFRDGDLGARAEPGGPEEVRQMIDQFNAMAEAIERQRRLRLQHLAGVAHDLKNPLNALQMSTSLIAPDAPLPPEAVVRRSLDVVRRQVARLNRMVDDLLETARIGAGDLPLILRDADLREEARAVAALFEGSSDGHTIDLDLPDRPVVVHCDPMRIEQTLTNLVSNAIKYSPRGTGVRIRVFEEAGSGKISVTDEGVGIAASDIPRLWEPFRRTGGVRETVPGAGLGLWTARRIAEAHGGTIEVESTLGRGSTFTLVVPSKRRQAEAKEAPSGIPGAVPAGAGS